MWRLAAQRPSARYTLNFRGSVANANNFPIRMADVTGMAVTRQTGRFVIDIAGDRMSAALTVPADLDPATVTEATLLAELKQAGLTPQPTWDPAIRDGVQQYHVKPDEPVTVTLHGQPAKHGVDGRFEWDADCDPNEQPVTAGRDGAADFYSHSAFIMIAEGQRLGRLHPPVPGEPGMTITGETASPRTGKEATLRIDKESVNLAGDGECTAIIAGVLHHEDDMLRIEPCLNIQENVDFSTGHVDFDGDVVVHEGVRDLFRVRATGSVQVRGLIEAGRITTGVDFDADGGMAGREKGRVNIGRDMNARHLSGVHGHVRRHLTVDREIINCELFVGGEVRAVRAVLVGGSIVATQRITVRDLGSQAGHETLAVLGCAPALEAGLAQAAAMLRRFDEQMSDDENDAFNTMVHRGGAAAEMRLDELKVAKHNLTQQRALIQSRYDAIDAVLKKRRRAELFVHRAIHPGVTLLHGDQAYTFQETLRGPLLIGHKPDRPGDLIVKDLGSNDQRALMEFTKLRVLSERDPLRQLQRVQAPKAVKPTD